MRAFRTARIPLLLCGLFVAAVVSSRGAASPVSSAGRSAAKESPRQSASPPGAGRTLNAAAL